MESREIIKTKTVSPYSSAAASRILKMLIFPLKPKREIHEANTDKPKLLIVLDHRTPQTEINRKSSISKNFDLGEINSANNKEIIQVRVLIQKHNGYPT